MSTKTQNNAILNKTITVDYDVWAKLRNIQTILAETEKNIDFSEIIDRGCHLLIKEIKEK